jgi:hypothetical protein
LQGRESGRRRERTFTDLLRNWEAPSGDAGALTGPEGGVALDDDQRGTDSRDETKALKGEEGNGSQCRSMRGVEGRNKSKINARVSRCTIAGDNDGSTPGLTDTVRRRTAVDRAGLVEDAGGGEGDERGDLHVVPARGNKRLVLPAKEGEGTYCL